MPKSQTSIKSRIRAVILAACLIALFGTAIGFVVYDASNFKSDLYRHLSTISALIADNVGTPLTFDNEENAIDVLSALKAEPSMESSAIYDLNGKLFAFYPETMATNDLPARADLGGKSRRGSVTLSAPIIQNGKQIGTLLLRFSLQGLYDRLWSYVLIVGAVFVVSIVGAFFLSGYLQQRISAPILALSNAAAAVAEKEDYSIRAPKLTEDELGLLTDDFNRMLAETQLHHARLTEQARLLDLSNDAIIVREAAGKIVYWNRGATEIYGWTSADAIGRHKSDLLKTEYPQPIEEIVQQMERDGRWSGELIQTRRDGAKIVVSTRWSLDRDPQGRPSSVLISDNDITERKRAEEQLRENEERFRALGDNIAQMAWMTDPEGNIFWYNRRWYDYTGTTFEEMKGWGWSKVHHADHLERVTQKWIVHLKQGANWEDTFPLRGKDGNFRWFLSRAFPIKDSNGKILRWFGTNTDITEQKLSEEQLERMVGERTAKLEDTIGELEAFSYSISHDMRSPLRAMQGYAKVLIEDYGKTMDDKARHYLERIQKGSQRLDLLIQDVLAYSKVAKGDIALHSVDIERLIDEILPSHPELQAPRAHISIERPLPAVIGHEAYLTQCVTNLLGNAARFAKAGEVPQIRVRAERFDGKIKLWFEDNGIGIDPSHFSRIFQIFGQVHGEKKYGGTGIGLAIVRKAVLRMNGEVGVESELGQGSRFWILLDKA
jgi:PAS domain S-box-containing protein